MHWFISHLIYLSLTKPSMQQCFHPSVKYLLYRYITSTQGGELGLIPLELHIFQKQLCLRKKYELFSHTFSLLIC